MLAEKNYFSHKKTANTKQLRKKLLNSLIRGNTNKKGIILVCEKCRNASKLTSWDSGMILA